MIEPVTFIEVSHPVEPGMKTYPGLPEPAAEVLVDYDGSRASYDGQAEFLIASLHLCGNTGTYVDAPIHRYRAGVDLAGVPLAHLAHLPVVVVDASDATQRGIGPGLFQGLDLRQKAVLVRTDWSRFWRTADYFKPHPFLTGDACDYLLEAGARFVGIDSLNIDDIEDLARPAHTKLLGAGVPVCEHLTNLASVPPAGTYLHAVPIAWVGGASFPVRAYVMQMSG
ncbi:MAG: cyclase family protein [Anaerolineae bacterium]